MLHYIIWLEIHIKLSTEHKIFCRCKNSQDFDNDIPNTNICPMCTAQPWALPILNSECIDAAVILWHVFWSQLNKGFKRDRKSYFYPDSPVWFQITQFHEPIIKWWSLKFFTNDFQNEDEIQIHESHLENDTAKTITINGTTFIDFNRSGTPLIEIVTKPEFTNDEQVVEFLKELQRVVKLNNIGYADLEKWQMRVDVNISVKDDSSTILGNRVELKNINSFASIRRAIQYEFQRQSQIINNEWKIDQETRRRNDAAWVSEVMRSKEDAMDYRYFPENDLPLIDHESINREPDIEIRSWYNRIALLKSYGFHKEYIYGLTNNELFYEWFSNAHILGYEAKLIAKWIMWPISNIVNEGWNSALKIDYNSFLIFLDNLKQYNTPEAIAKQIMEKILVGEDIKNLIPEFDVWSKSDSDLDHIISEVITANPTIVDQYKWGKLTVIMFLVWQAMKLSQGKSNPLELKAKLEEKLI